MLGATAKVTNSDDKMRAMINTELFSFLPSDVLIADFNDRNSTTLSDVLAIYDKALAKLKGEFNNNV